MNGGEEKTSWQGSWRPQAGPHHEPHAKIKCSNNHVYGRHTDWPCSCFFCHERNRGVWVTAYERPETPVAEVQARLSSGMAGKFGPVETVFPVEGRDRLVFVVR